MIQFQVAMNLVVRKKKQKHLKLKVIQTQKMNTEEIDTVQQQQQENNE